MDQEQFARVFTTQMKACEETLNAKAAEYAKDYDRLHNFKVAKTLQSKTTQQALGGMMAKHTVSIYDMLEVNDDTLTMAQWDEKITDHINYLVLLKAIVTEAYFDSSVK